MRPGRWSLARQLLALQATLLVLLVALEGLALALDTRAETDERAREQVVGLAEALAVQPTLLDAVDDADPSTVLQPWAERVRAATGVRFVVAMAPDRIRWSHPDPDEIGRSYVGTVGPALEGRTIAETYVGTLGRSVRAVAPVERDGRVVALVAVGISTAAVETRLRDRLESLGAAAALVLLVALTGAVLVSRRLRRQTHGMAEGELTRLREYYDAVLHSVREGVVLVDRAGRVDLVNDEARRLLDLDEGDEVVGRTPADAGLPASLAQLVAAGEETEDALHLAGRRVLVVSQRPAVWEGRRLGTVLTMRDRTELQRLTGELGDVRALAEALRSQAHEASSRMHTVVSLVELGRYEQAVEFATAEIRSAQRLTDAIVSAVADPVLAAMLLGKASRAQEHGVELVVEAVGAPPAPLDVESARDLVTVVGNLVDNAVDAAAAAPAPRVVQVLVGEGDDGLLVVVSDTGPGLDAAHADDVFRRGWSTKDGGGVHGRGLGLALVRQVVDRLGGTVTVAARERPGSGTDVGGGTDVDGGTGATGGAVFTVRLPAGWRGAGVR